MELSNFTPIGSLIASGSSGIGAPPPKPTLKDDFLRLLIAQMQNQDPLNPSDPTEFTSQLAQFSSLEQLISINDVLAAQNELQVTAISTSAVSFIGKTAEVLTDRIALDGEGDVEMRFALAYQSASTSVAIRDETGTLVRTIELGPMDGGSHRVSWDGANDSGFALPDGSYSFTVIAEGEGGEPIAVQTSRAGVINAVSFADGAVLLKIGDDYFALADLVSLEISSLEN